MKKIKFIFILAAVVLSVAMILVACDIGDVQSGYTHEYVEVAAKDPTCSESGNIMYYTCTCGKYFDKDKNEISLSDTVLAPTGQHTESGWIEDSAATCEAKARHHKECTVCHKPLENEEYGDLAPHSFGEWSIDSANYTCGDTVSRSRQCQNCGHKETEDNYKVPHEWNNAGKCDVCGKDKPYDERGGKIYFGEYPKTRETDNGIVATLAQMSGERPVKGNSGKWTDYGYYYKGAKEEFMWYIDLEYDGAKYRGVYFDKNRPYMITGTSTYQKTNGYMINNLYWFKWEPIEWNILEKKDGAAFLMSGLVLDSHEVYLNDTTQRTVDGKTVFPNNYKESTIRAWLNGEFYDLAFDELDQSLINITLVENGETASGWDRDGNICEDTMDRVFLLSYADVINTAYGFEEDIRAEDAKRTLAMTDYAKCQGIKVESASPGSCGWWLRTPASGTPDSMVIVTEKGKTNYSSTVSFTHRGVVPAIWITL